MAANSQHLVGAKAHFLVNDQRERRRLSRSERRTSKSFSIWLVHEFIALRWDIPAHEDRGESAIGAAHIDIDSSDDRCLVLLERVQPVLQLVTVGALDR